MTSSLTRYYSEDSSNPFPNIFEPAQTAFDQALETFKQRSTKNPTKKPFVLQGTSLRDVLDAVAALQERYKNEHTKSKARRCITELSKRICHYGNVMDVLVQHHPEYVALAWGAMKLVFGAIVEYENIGTALITGLCDIADALPRVELAVFLYPTNVMKQAVSVLYAYIIKFLVRASEWYEEGKILRALHSVTKPAALRYDDLIGDIRRATRGIADLAITSCQAEQRDVHHELQALALLVKQLREDVLLDQSIKASTLLNCENSLSDIQLMQALALVSSACSVDYKSSFQTSLLIRDKHPLASNRSKHNPFLMSSKLHTWNTSQSSSVVTLRATFKDRFYIGHFCTNVIEQLRSTDIDTLWVLKPRQKIQHSVSEVLKSLIHQALSLDRASHTDSRSTFHLREFLDAHFENDYVNVLGNILEHTKLVYIIVEAGAMDPAGAFQCEVYLRDLSQRLSEKGAATVVKVMTLTYGPHSRLLKSNDGIVLRFGKTPHRIGEKLSGDLLQGATRSSRLQIRRGNMNPALPVHIRGRAVKALGD